MIQPNELRIGNWVNIHHFSLMDTVETNKVKAILQTHIEVIDLPDLNRRELVSIHPIPLTPEVLEKCGFDKASDSYGGLLAPEHHEERIRIRSDEFSFYYSVHEAAAPVRLEYLHQLQNLYYALTGEELNYKP